MIPRDTHVLNPDELRRLTGQNQAIYRRLCDGPAWNYELAQLALKYTSRISDIRKAIEPKGWTVKEDGGRYWLDKMGDGATQLAGRGDVGSIPTPPTSDDMYDANAWGLSAPEGH